MQLIWKKKKISTSRSLIQNLFNWLPLFRYKCYPLATFIDIFCQYFKPIRAIKWILNDGQNILAPHPCPVFATIQLQDGSQPKKMSHCDAWMFSSVWHYDIQETNLGFQHQLNNHAQIFPDHIMSLRAAKPQMKRGVVA